MGVSDDREESESEGTQSRRRRNRRKKKKNGAVISREELRWLWYDESEATITEVEETWNLGKNLGIKSIEIDSAMARKIEKLMCLEIGGSTKGRRGKRREVREMVSKLRIEICCLKETKMEEVNKSVCKSFWGNSLFDWAWLGSVGNSGGVLTIWNSDLFQKISSWSITGMLVVNDRWVEDGSDCTIVNIYALNSVAQRSELWEILRSLVRQIGTASLCIIGDFNMIREESERVGRAGYWDIGEMERFNNFIEGSDLVEIQLVGRRFTWYRPDGMCKSKLDCMLVNSNWLNKWSGAILRGGKRSLSDHIPIYIEGNKKDWGPRPFKFFNQWIQHPSYKGLIEKVWSSSLKQGWSDFVIKEKLEELKVELKAWSKEMFNGMERMIEVKKEEIERLDILDDTFGLEEEEITRRQDLLGDLMMESSWKESQMLQKSKIKWLQEGDANSTFFHNWVKSRHKRNEITGLWNNNTLVESVQGVKQLAHDHFKKQFEAIEKKSAYFSEALFRSYVGTTDNEVLRLFELTSGLRVNFRKSCVYGVSVTEAAAVLGCKIGRGPVDYLGMKVGTNHHRKETWEWLVEKIKCRILKWDGKNISMGGVVTRNITLSTSPLWRRASPHWRTSPHWRASPLWRQQVHIGGRVHIGEQVHFGGEQVHIGDEQVHFGGEQVHIGGLVHIGEYILIDEQVHIDERYHLRRVKTFKKE
ncbi:hypothetical protein ACS0TY_021917 [Phlomoides rotata]